MSYAPIGSDIPGTGTNGSPSVERDPVVTSKRRSRNGRSRAISTPGSSLADGQVRSWPIIVHCHLSWDWVWQRPQQFVSRLSQRHPVLFVETLPPDPQLVCPTARFFSPERFPNLTVLRIQFPSWRWSDGSFVDRKRRELLMQFLEGPGAGRFENPIQWFYDPMAAPCFIGQVNEVLTVYDCMDELSKFRGAPPEICAREKLLLEAADVVFTGGRRLYESKRLSNNNCHFHGCGVEVDHFARARLSETRVPDDIARMPRPVLGYFGVIDERMDYELLEKLADANPAWSIAMVGPVLKVDPKSLPARPNLQWLGQRDYADLPACCKGFDVCLMPFALNESTQFINPTKALEYMASGRPIVSSEVPDVVSNFGEVVKVARSHEEFIGLCRTEAALPDAEAVKRGLAMAASNTWESIVAQLENHIEAALLSKRTTEVLA